MHRILLCGAVAACTLTCPVQAGTHNCTAVDDKASVGVGSNDSVTITSRKKYCGFSVNGYSVDGKTMADARNGINNVGDISSSGGVSTNLLAALLVAPLESVDSGLRNSLSNQLASNQNNLDSCIRAFRQRQTYSFGEYGSQVLCRVVQATKEPIKLGPIVVSLPIDHIQIGARLSDDGYSVVFIPIVFLQRRLSP